MKTNLKDSFRLFFGVLALAAVTSRTAAAAGEKVNTRKLPAASGVTSILMDYIACDPSTGFVWIPAGNTGAVDVIDSATSQLKQVTGFPTAEVGPADRKRVVGPSSVSIGEGSVYIGNRGDSSIASFDAKTLAHGAYHRLDAMPDGVAYVAATREVWVTTPRDKSIRVLDASTLAEKEKITLDGGPEGFAVDNGRGRFYTNLEDKDRTLAIDLKTRKVVATWNCNCGEEGPRGLRVDAGTGYLFVACTAKVEVLDAAHGGEVLSSVETGEGVDDIDYLPSQRLLYAGASKAGQLTVAQVDAKGKLSIVSTVKVPAGSRNPAATPKGAVYLAHSAGAEVVIVEPGK